jgi:hypothetical protein
MGQLLGFRVFLHLPKKEETKLVVDENTKEALQKEMLVKMSKLKVVQVGLEVTKVKEGDIVLVDPATLSKAMIIPLSPTEDVLLVSYHDIMYIW